ncbi:hypothetical protein B0H14DRAFT_3867465 [Mycena olivaceomarginata]|nr:hypothetical protein B0H14DRAFT_3867465 [Mycena olivaceomarginata]
MYDAITSYGLPSSIIDLNRAAQTNTKCFIRTAHGITEPITITGVTKQGRSLLPVKSTLTTSLGHHYLNDLMSTDPDALVITSGHTQKADPHLPDDALQTTIVMAEATDDSYIFACSLSLLHWSALAMERFQFAYRWLTQWTKSMAYILEASPDTRLTLIDSVDFDSITNVKGVDPLTITVHKVKLTFDELDFLRAKVDDLQSRYEELKNFIDDFTFPKFLRRPPITLLRKIVKQNIVSKAHALLTLSPSPNAITSPQTWGSDGSMLPAGAGVLDRKSVTTALTGANTMVLKLEGHADDRNAVLYTDHLNSVRLVDDSKTAVDQQTRLRYMTRRSYYRWILVLVLKSALKITYTPGHSDERPNATLARVPTAPIPTFFMDEFTFCTPDDGWIESNIRNYTEKSQSSTVSERLGDGHQQRMSLALYDPKSPPEYPYTHAYSAYSAVVQLYARSGQLPTADFSLSLRRSTSPGPSIAESNEPPDPGPDRNPLTPDTVWQCSECKLPVKVGLAGQHNYDEHQGSTKCRDQVAANKKQEAIVERGNFMQSFFKPTPKQVPPTVPTPPLVQPHVSSGGRFSLAPESQHSPSSSIARSPSPRLSVESPIIAPQHSPSPSIARSPSPASPVESLIIAPRDSICPGVRLTFPPGENQHTSYPFGLHAEFSLPWNYFSEGEHFFLRSNCCRQRVPGPEPRLCKPCDELDRRDDFLDGIRERITNGINENTPLMFFPFGGLIRRVRKKNDQLRAMRLTKLNDTRILAGKIAELDLHKQLMMAIATSDERRISQLIRVGLKNGESISAMLDRFYRACVDVHREGPKYNPKGFTPDDYMRSGTAAARQIDWKSSTCLNPLNFQMSAAMKSSEKSPCSNHLIECPLQCGVVLWTYNLTAHYNSYHALKSLSNIPAVYQMAELERERMKVVWNNRQVYPSVRRMKKQKMNPQLRISDAHRSTMAWRQLEEEDPTPVEGDSFFPENLDDVPRAPGRRAHRQIVQDSDSDSYSTYDDSIDVRKIKQEADDALEVWDDVDSDGSLEYFDEESVSRLGLQALESHNVDREMNLTHPQIEPYRFVPASPTPELRPLEDDDVDREIMRVTAPQIEHNLSVYTSPTSPAPSPISNSPDAVGVNSPATSTPELSALRPRTKRKAAEVECICGNEVTNDQRESDAVKCIRAGCETIWFHIDCAAAEEWRRNGVCNSCERTKKRR